MKKRIIIVLIIMFCVTPVSAETVGDLYGIQLGVFKYEQNAENFFEQLKSKGLDSYQINTSIYSVFYDIYPFRSKALQDIDKARSFVKDAYVVKLNKKQHAVYLAERGLSNDIIAKSKEKAEIKKGIKEETKDISDDKLSVEQGEDKQQIVINKTSRGDLEYVYRVLNDIELRGIKGESKWFFNVEKGMKVKDFKLNLFLRVNQLIKRDISYFTVYMNDRPLKSMKLIDSKDKLLNSRQIDIPVSLIKEGYNELKLRTHSRISDDACEDDKNIANWVLIDGNTNYVILYDKVYSSLDISDFPRPFVGIYADDARGIGVVIPDNYSDTQISAALTLIAHMKDYSFAYAVPTTLLKASDPSLAEFESLIYIGDFINIPSCLKSIIKKQGELSKGNAHLYESIIDNNQRPIFMIVSDNDQKLITAVKSLKNTDIKEQMLSNHIMLKPDLKIDIKEEDEDDNYIYLEDLGINGIEVKGSNQQVTNIGLRIPSNQVLANESNINLRIRYSDNLDFEKSVVSAYINGVPIGSHKLERDKRDLHIMKFYIPESLRRNNYYDLRIVFELIPSGIIYCERYLASVPWAYIQKDSNYFFPTQERRLMLLNNLSFPFSRDDDLDATTIILPDKPDLHDLKIAGKFAELTGIGVKKNKGTIDAIRWPMFNEKYYNNNLIIFSTPEENSAIKDINQSLWFQYNNQFTAVLSNEKIELLPETSTTATFIELKTSPYNSDKGMMTMTSLDKNSIIKAIEYFGDHKRGLLTGDAAIISKNGDLKTFRFQKDEDLRPAISTKHTVISNMREYLIFTGLVLLLLIISLIFYKLKNRKKNR